MFVCVSACVCLSVCTISIYNCSNIYMLKTISSLQINLELALVKVIIFDNVFNIQAFKTNEEVTKLSIFKFWVESLS